MIKFDLTTLIFYLLIAVLFSVWLYVYDTLRKDNTCIRIFGFRIMAYQLYSFSLFLFLFFIACFRSVEGDLGGADVNNYINYFLNAKYIPISVMRIIRFSEFEPIFYNALYLMRLITDDYHLMFFVIYSIIIYSYIFFVNKNVNCKEKNYFWLFIPLFILPYLKSFNIIRQSLAVAIGLFAINCFKEKKYWRFGIICIINFLIHYLSIIIPVFAIYYLVVKKFFSKDGILKNVQYLVLQILSILACFILVPLFKGILANTGYAGYLNPEISLLGYAPFFLQCLLVFIFKVNLRKELENDNNTIHLIIFQFNCLVFPFSVMFGAAPRFNLFLDFSRFILWAYIYKTAKPSLIKFIDKKNININDKIIDLCVYIVVLMWIIFRIIRMWKGYGLMPYYLEFFTNL